MVAALVISVSTGWRIASTDIDPGPLLRWIDALFLQSNVMRWHFISATALVTLVAAYLAFLWKQQLGGRLKLNWASLQSSDRTTRWLTGVCLFRDALCIRPFDFIETGVTQWLSHVPSGTFFSQLTQAWAYRHAPPASGEAFQILKAERHNGVCHTSSRKAS
jgi:hypothetical protein